MNTIIERIFGDYDYIETWKDDDKRFFVNSNRGLASYYLTYSVDASDKDMSPEQLIEKLNSLETEFIEEGDKQLRVFLLNTFQDEMSASQLDKNLSVIFTVKLGNLSSLEKYKNFIYSVEESPYYFRRFVLPYTDNQVNELKKVMEDFPEKTMSEILTNLSNDEEAYYSLASNQYSETLYEFVIRLFSKIPFLQYRFMANQKPLSVEERLQNEMPIELVKYHDAVEERIDDIEKLINLFSENISSETINSKIRKIVGDGVNVTV